MQLHFRVSAEFVGKFAIIEAALILSVIWQACASFRH